MIDFPRPEAFVQSVRQRCRALPADAALIIVEGASDKAALFPFLAGNSVVIPAGANNKVVRAFDDLEPPLRNRVLFILDCDGDTESRLKGHAELIITTNRDLESDLLLELRTAERVAYELMSAQYSRPQDVALAVAKLLKVGINIASTIGSIRKAANALGLRTRMARPQGGKPEKVRLSKMPRLGKWIRAVTEPTFRDLVDEFGSLLGWTSQEISDVSACVALGGAKQCRRHSVKACVSCWPMSYCNGHDLVDALATVFREAYKINISTDNLDKMIRVAVDRTMVGDWTVMNRIKTWESEANIRVLAPLVSGGQ